MPIIKSARKKMRQDKKRRVVNLITVAKVKKSVSKARKNPSIASLKSAYSALDMAAKKKIIHKNKAARLKSRLAKNKVQKTPKVKKSKKR